MKCSRHEIKVITGASYGDEGKGLMTDYFCRNACNQGKKCLTVFHNGGAQRGHTVSLKNGVRHVFHHLSSGTFSKSDTYFADTFILNPLIFADEYSELLPETKIYYSEKCQWTTPFDMMINQIAEDYRGADRHGSCGYGIWETIVRYKNTSTVNFPDFLKMSEAEKYLYLKNIRDVYLLKRLKELGVKSIPEEWKETISQDSLISNFIADCKYSSLNMIKADDSIIEDYPYIVFEGAQGLLLSQTTDAETEKHTTPSFTGAENPVRLISKLSGKNSTEVCYISRTYLTRHGAGPFEGECDKAQINPLITDLTNVPNGYQGTIRYGRLDCEKLKERIFNDFSKYSGIDNIKLSLAVTHLNEADGRQLLNFSGFSEIYCSESEYSEDVKLSPFLFV